MAWRSKLCGHLVLVTGSLKGWRVSGHRKEMRSRAMAMSSSEPPPAAAAAGEAERLRLLRARVRRAGEDR